MKVRAGCDPLRAFQPPLLSLLSVAMANSNQLSLLRRVADALERLAPAATASAALDKADAFVWHADGRRLEAVRQGQPHRPRPAARHRPAPATCCSTIRAASPRACRPTTPCSGARAAPARARWSRPSMPPSMRRRAKGGIALIEIHREDLASLPALARAPARTDAPLPAVLRRPLLRRGRHQLQIAEGRARGRHRGPAGQRRCSTPPRTAAI